MRRVLLQRGVRLLTASRPVLANGERVKPLHQPTPTVAAFTLPGPSSSLRLLKFALSP
jgi:hypothetical protein